MSFAELKQLVLQTDLCASCGACSAVCPQDVISISPDEPVPALVTGASAEGCGACTLCSDVCPGLETAVPQSEQRIFGRTRDAEERWTGITRATYSARAGDPAVLGAASAGGAATALLVSALRSGRMDAALVIGRDEERPWVPVPRLVTTVEDIVQCAQASYCLTPNLQLLRHTTHERIGVVGLPCQLEAINRMRNLAEPPPAVERIAFTIEIACASNTLREGTEFLIEERLRLPLVEVTQMKYRDGAHPGKFTVRDRRGQERSLPFHQLIEDFKKFKTYRCLSCPDWWSGLADVSIADGEPDILSTSRSGGPPRKASVLVTRTDTGQALVDQAVANGELWVEVEDTFVPEQNLGLQRKRHRSASYAASSARDVPRAPVAADEQ